MIARMERPIVSFRLSLDEFQGLEAEAVAAGLKRADYVRAKVLAPDQSRRIKELEQQVNKLEKLAALLQQRLQETSREQPTGLWNKLTKNLGSR